MSLREELVDYFPEEEVEELFSGCCMLYDVVGDSYVDQNFEVTLLHYTDTVEEYIEHAKEFEKEHGIPYDIDNADTFYEEEYLLKHKSGKEVVVHQLFQVYLQETTDEEGNRSWEESSIKLSGWGIDEG